ncbi:hypothetical protein GJ744_001480 [Endocarpon pusillum]|uniref:Uncharacterized protein n=1 Tax=Endocarpon pusillum TaxID=364733 RepID=A0A8H7ADC2_9EURO|nr:hypothetical protein GJ744_001480 [Endocarpon pusillum]
MSSKQQVTSDTSSSRSTSTLSSLKSLLKIHKEKESSTKTKRQPIVQSEEQKRTEMEARAAYFSLR